jgi:imidazolonepropionase-like amidohydrolase
MTDKQYILWDVTLIDGKGNEPVEHAAVLVKDGKIEAVGHTDSMCREDGARVLDLAGMTVMPGIVDAHVHISGVKSDRVSAFTIHPTVRAYKSVLQAQAMTAYGITAVRDISPLGLYLKRMIRTGELTGPRIIACGQGLARSGGHADIPELPFESVDNPHEWGSRHYWGVFADGEIEIRKKIRLMLREGADQIKFWASGGGYSTVDPISDVHYTLDECKAIVDEAKLIRNMPVLSHAENIRSIEYSIEAGVDSIEHGDELNEECAEKMAARGIYFVPTLNLVANWYLDRFGDNKVEATPISVEYGPFRTLGMLEGGGETADGYKIRDQIYGMFQMAREKGVKIAMGSDTVRDLTTEYGAYSIREMRAMAEAGMTNLEAIRAATETSSEVLKLDRYIGTIEPGKLADLLVLRKNPAENLDVLLDKKNILYVIADGIIKVENGKMTGFGEGFPRG